METTSKDVPSEQELAYILLVELMAYQFASPVQWIQSQESILTKTICERIIEIGPSNTLTSMLRKTLTSKFEAFDIAHSIQRQILSINKEADEISYDMEAPGPAPQTEISPDVEEPVVVPITEKPTLIPDASNQIASRPLVAIEDKRVTVSQIIRAIICHKLQKSPQQISWNLTIKTLVSGRSTLENEIVGDLGSEFGAMPERVEENPLDEVCSALQVSFSGQLGKQSSLLVSRMISSKMPGGFSLSAAKRYLESRWALGPGLQDGALLFAVTSQPSARLASESAAHEFLDAKLKEFATTEGIDLSSPQTTRAETGPSSMIHPKAVEELTQRQLKLARMQFEVLARYLDVDLSVAEKISKASKEKLEALQSQLDLFQLEHGDFYLSAIKPRFDPLKCRTFTSYWNWAAQDLLAMYHDILSGRLDVTDSIVVEKYACIVARADQRVLDIMPFLTNTAGDFKSTSGGSLHQILESLLTSCRSSLGTSPRFKVMWKVNAPHSFVDDNGVIQYTEVPRSTNTHISSFVEEAFKSNGLLSLTDIAKLCNYGQSKSHAEHQGTPIIFMKSHRHGGRYERNATLSYLESLKHGASDGLTFHKKNVLLTGAGSGSIGAELLVGLLAGGAQVIVTTSRFSPDVARFYQNIYTRYGARGSKLVVVPFNQGSNQDIESLANYVYDPTCLGWDLDHIIPFAAISEHEREIDAIDSKSEFAHRVMLTNTVRLLGAIKRCKVKYGSRNRPVQVILPLSANHGIFGNDGLYSESKSALESLFNKWHSESWSGYLSICGASIGWTRGTNLMASNDWLSQDIEKAGIRTFSQQEMAFAILCLMTPCMTRLCDREPQFADLNGGLGSVPNFKGVLDQIRGSISSQSKAKKAIAEQEEIEDRVINGDPKLRRPVNIEPCPSVRMGFPPLPGFDTEILPLQTQLEGMVDLGRVVVITGFSEVGPHGNARTRWEIEAHGEFSIEGCIEMAWLMGLIRYHNGPFEGGTHYTGWLDTKTKGRVRSNDVKSRYEKYILEHTGIRVMEPELLDGYDPQKKPMLHEVVVEEDLKAIEASKAVADDFKRLHGDKVDVYPLAGSNDYSVQIKAGATLMIPKAMRFDNAVAGLIPTGWDARTYGIEEDIISQVDNVTLYVLVSTIEALISSGITDPYEIYQYIHVSEVGNCIGSGLGGMRSQEKMYYGRVVEKEVQQDILQETFINTTAAWVNMLLMSSSGPIRTPVGACATSIESVELGCDTIASGKAKFCLVGGFDDMTAAVNFEFANMKATANADRELAKGRIPKEMSRPATTTRSGFVESQGAGIQVLTTAELALKMGLPIYGIVAWSGTASDKTNRSVPAPGNGLLTNARETVTSFPSPLLNIETRRRRLRLRQSQINENREIELKQLDEDMRFMKLQDPSADTAEFWAHRKEYIDTDTERQVKEALNSLGNQFWHGDSRISPIRGALATWNLTIDDLDVVSMHGTSTVKNEKNETEVLQSQLRHLGRAKGNTVFAVTQKYLTGHSKGAAGAWMLNGALQILETGLVPGNRNADDIDVALQKHEHVLFLNQSIQTKGVKAVSITSFGFGQKGAQAIVVHPKYLFATISKAKYEEYGRKRGVRERKTRRYFNEGFVNNTLFVAKNSPAHAEERRVDVLLNPNARLDADGKTVFN